MDDDTKTIFGFIKGQLEAQSKAQGEILKEVRGTHEELEKHIRQSIQRKADQDTQINNAKREAGEAKKEIKEHKGDHEKTKKFILKIVGAVITGLVLAGVLTYFGLR